MGMMVVNANNSPARTRYGTVPSQYQLIHTTEGTLIFRVWFSKISTGTSDPVVMLELKGGTSIAAPTALLLMFRWDPLRKRFPVRPNRTQLVLAVNIPVNSPETRDQH